MPETTVDENGDFSPAEYDVCFAAKLLERCFVDTEAETASV